MKKRIPFNSYSSVFTKKSKRISFNIIDNFDFSSTKNVITMRFVNPLVKSFMRMFISFKKTSIKVKNNTYKLFLQLFGVINSDMNIKTSTKGTIKTDAKSKPIGVDIDAHTSSSVNVFAKEEINFSINAFINEQIQLFSSSKTSVKFNASFNSSYDMFVKAESKIYFINNYNLPISFEACATVKENLINFCSYINPYEKLYLKQNNNVIKPKTVAEGFLYRPNLLESLYEPKLEELYDKTLEEIFYGYEIL